MTGAGDDDGGGRGRLGIRLAALGMLSSPIVMPVTGSLIGVRTLLEPGLDLGDRGERAEPRLVDLLEQGDAAGDERGGEAGSFHGGGP